MAEPYCVRTKKRPPSGRGLGHVTQFRNFGTPLITLPSQNSDLFLKFILLINCRALHCQTETGWYLRQKPVGGGGKAGGLLHPSLSPFPPLPLSIPPKLSDKAVGGKVRSSEGEVPRLPSYKYHRARCQINMPVCTAEG